MKTMDALYKNTLDGFLASAWSKFTVSRTKWGMSIFQGNHLSPIPYYQNILSAAEYIVGFIDTFWISFFVYQFYSSWAKFSNPVKLLTFNPLLKSCEIF